MDDKYSQLVEKDAVIEVLNTLFIETDNRNWSVVRECFANSVLFDMTSMAGGDPVIMTPQQITDAWDQGLKSLQAIHHQVGNFNIRIKTNEAQAFCYGLASHHLPNKTGNNTRTFVGSYNFHLIKMKDRWKISQFKFNLKYIEGNPDLEANQQQSCPKKYL